MPLTDRNLIESRPDRPDSSERTLGRHGQLLPWTLARLLLAVALCAILWGQEGGDTIAGVPIIIDGEEVARVYGSIGKFTPGDREPEIKHRILRLAEKGYAGEISTRTIASENTTAVVVGPLLIMNVTEVDAQYAGVSRDELARRYADNIRKAIDTYRIRHSWSNLLAAIAKTLLAWLLFFISAWALWKALAWLGRRLKQRFDEKAIRSGSRFNRLILERVRPVLMTLLNFVAAITLLSAFSRNARGSVESNDSRVTHSTTPFSP